MGIIWHQLQKISSKQFICGHCGSDIASEDGYLGVNQITRIADYAIFVCHKCEKPNFFDNPGSKQVPSSLYGDSVSSVDGDILEIYDQARRCFSVNGFAAVVLLCRKLLMHIAVAHGAEENLSYLQYVDFILESGLVGRNSKIWIDKIRKVGNDENHKLIISTEEEAKNLIDFSSMILKILYEYPNRASVKYTSDVN